MILSRLAPLALAVTLALAPRPPAQAAEPQSLAVEPVVVETRDGPVTFAAEIADDGGERSVGMMHRTEIGPREAMLFQYPRPTRVSMWMRNTLVPLDMLFITAGGEIVHIEHDAQPHDETPRGPVRLVRGVLEVRGGEAERLGIEEGMTVRHAFFGTAPTKVR